MQCGLKPLVTIGTCARNCQDSLAQAIESIINQDFPHELMEIIFIDDGSEDGTLAIIHDFVLKMAIASKVFHTEWKGLGPARNIVVNNARGDYILWVDADMILPRDHVRKQVQFMEQHPEAGIAKATHGMMPKQGLVATLEDIAYMVEDYKFGGQVEEKLPGTGGSIYRRNALEQVCGFDENIKGVGEDLDAAYRIKEAGWLIFRRTPAIFYEKRKKTWKELWKQYYWYGNSVQYWYGPHAQYPPDRIVALHKMIPLAGFLTGLLYCSSAYRLSYTKVTFLLPLHFGFKTAAWFLGFIAGTMRRKHRWFQ